MEISIIIPTFNREVVLRQTLDNLKPLADKYPIEIIIVNDGETLKENYTAENIHVFKNPKKGVTAARNFGAAKAKSDILFFLDDDMWCNEDAIKAILSFKERGLTNTSCFLMNWEYPAELKEKLNKEKIGRYLLNANYHTLEGRLMDKVDNTLEFKQIDSIGSCSFVISKQLFAQIGGYNESYIFQGEDIAIAQTINRHHIPILLSTQITCFHNHKDRLDIEGMMDRDYRGYYSQFFQHGDDAINSTKSKFYKILLHIQNLILKVYNLIPNSPAYDKLTFRFLGLIGNLSKTKAYRDAKKQNK